MTTPTGTIRNIYTWAWVEGQKSQVLKRKLRDNPDIIINSLTKELLQRPVPHNSGYLAARILRYLPDTTFNRPSGNIFFRSIQKTQLFCPENPDARTELFDLTVHAITQGKNNLSHKVINFSHCCDNELVFLACMHGNLSALWALIDQGADINCLGDDNNTPLHIAALTGEEDLFNLLIQQGSDVDAKNAFGKTPLHLAVENNHINIVQRCIKNAANLDAQDNDGNTPLFIAYKEKKIVLALELIIAGADPLVENNLGKYVNPDFVRKPLALEILKEFPLLCDLIRINQTKQTISAIVLDNIDYFLSTSSTIYNGNPIELAFILDNEYVLKGFFNKLPPEKFLDYIRDIYTRYPKFRERLFSLLCLVGCKQAIECLIGLGININAPKKNGIYPIHNACISKRIDIVRLLLENGANIDVQDDKKNTPFGLALQYRSEKLLQLLLEFGCDVTIPNAEGNSALHVMVISNLIHFVSLLVPDHCQVDIKNIKGKTALHIACSLGNNEAAIDLLLKLGADPNSVDHKGSTPLHIVCKNGDNTTAIKLYQKGAKPWISNQSNQTALDIAIQEGMNSFVDHVFKNYGHIHFLMDVEDGCENLAKKLCENPNQLLKAQMLEPGAIPLEVPMLLRSERLARSMMRLMTSTQVDNQFGKLSQKYPKECLYFLQDCFYQQVPDHLTKGAIHLIDIPEPPNIDIEVLNNLFIKINFTNPKKTGYQNPEKLTDDGASTTVPVVKAGLKTLIQRIKNLTPYRGTPPSKSPQLIVFYRNLHKLMKHITKGLVETDDPMMKSNSLVDLGVAGLHCGIRWITQAHQSYQMIHNGSIPLTFAERILELLRTYRSNVLLNVIAESDVHLYNQLLSLAGKELGIMGASALTGYEDVYANRDITKEELLERFYSLYTSHAIVEFAKEEMNRLYKTLDTQDLVVDWFKDHIPENWEKDKFDQLVVEVQDLVRRNKTKKVICRYLMKHQVYCNETGDPFKAIEDFRKASYLEEEVFEKNEEGDLTSNFRREAIIHLLMKLEIFHQAELKKQDENSHPRKRRKRELVL